MLKTERHVLAWLMYTRTATVICHRYTKVTALQEKSKSVFLTYGSQVLATKGSDITHHLISVSTVQPHSDTSRP
jgi:hypothetical protein